MEVRVIGNDSGEKVYTNHLCGLALIEKFNEKIEVRALKEQVFAIDCSHVGGRKYAEYIVQMKMEKCLDIGKTIHNRDHNPKIPSLQISSKT